MRKALLQISYAIFFAFLMMNTASSSDFVDAPAPDFALRGIDGHTLRLSEFRSDIVLLSFSSERCTRCRQSMPLLEELFRLHAVDGLQVISVDIDGNSKSAENVAKELGLTFPVLLDTDQSVSRLYDLNRLPLILLIDREGTVRFENKGFRGDSGAQISAKLDRLLAD